MLIVFFVMKLRNCYIKNFQNILSGINKIKYGLYEKIKSNVIGRIVIVNPNDSERYYLYLLLNHIRSATSFQHLRNVNGIQTLLLREAAQLHRLLK